MDKLKEARVNQGADLYFDTYTSAVQKAKADAEKAGYKVDEDDWDTQITTGQGKPSRGKTVRHNIKLTKNGKPTRKGLAIQVFNRDTDSKTYELNSYVS
jgi:predicted aspartyl protease